MKTILLFLLAGSLAIAQQMSPPPSGVGDAMHIANSAELAGTGTDLLDGAGNFAVNGLTGWTVTPAENADDWSIVMGKLHHEPGTAASRIVHAVAVMPLGTAYVMGATVTAKSAGYTALNIGPDCWWDCSGGLIVGSNRYFGWVANYEGDLVVEIAASDDADITISAVTLKAIFPALYRIGGPSHLAIGYDALSANTTGTRNIALGMRALTHQTTGDDNVAIGGNTLYSQTSGSNRNVAVGSGALLNLITNSSNNVAVGANALVGVSSGGNNAGLGYQAGSSFSSGNYNTFVGAGSFTTGAADHRTVIGAEAMGMVNNSITLGRAIDVVINPPSVITDLPGCTSDIEGAEKSVTDSSTAVWGAVVTDGGSSHVKVRCNGTDWTVVGK